MEIFLPVKHTLTPFFLLLFVFTKAAFVTKTEMSME